MSHKIQISRLVKNNFCILILFIFSTFFFIYQHNANISWDFSAHVLNAKYLFYNGIYFETYRPPLPVFVLGGLLIFKTFGEYIYIVLVSALFLFSNISLSDTIFKEKSLNKGLSKKYTRFIFYFFSLSGFTLMYGLLAGTELFSLALIELFFAGLIKGKTSGHFLGLAVLARYTSLIFVPFLFFNKNYRKILKNVALFVILLFPWLLFNYIKFGNWFASIVDSYALNIFLRGYLIEPFNPAVLLKVIGWFLPFLILGIIIAIITFVKEEKKFSKSNRIILLFIALFVIIVLDFTTIPLKIERYLFNLALPSAFFSTLGLLVLIKNKKIRKLSLPALLIAFLIVFIGLTYSYYQSRDYDEKFYNAAADIESFDIKECMILSPHWVPMHYLAGNVYALGANPIYSSIYENKIILIFTDSPTVDDSFTMEELKSYSTLKKTDKYVFLAKQNISKETCSKKYVFDNTYVNNHCEIIASKFKKIKLSGITLKLCKKINNI